MTEKAEKLSAKLAHVHKNAEESRRLIAFHKKMLKTYLRKEKELTERLEKEQLNALFRTVRDGGCDIASINAAIKNGEFGGELAERFERELGDPTSDINDKQAGGDKDISSKDKEDK